MGANFSQKDSKRVTKDLRHMSCDILDEPALKTYPRDKRSTSRSKSVDAGPYYERKMKSSVSSGDSSNSLGVDFPDHPFAVKIQEYIRSIEKLSDITDLKFQFGHFMLKTADGELSVEVNEEGIEPFVSLEEDRTNNSGFLLYTYKSSTKGLGNKYSYSSLIYFSDIYKAKSKVFILQARMNTPYGMPNFIPTKIRTSDNPKLISHNSRFIGMFDSQSIRTPITHVSQYMEAYYLSQTDMSLDFSTDEQQAVVFHFVPYKACY